MELSRPEARLAKRLTTATEKAWNREITLEDYEDEIEVFESEYYGDEYEPDVTLVSKDELPTKRYCIDCGATIRSDDTYCSKCGTEQTPELASD